MSKTGAEKNSNVALYTKYRPAKFSDVLGQDHVVSVLRDSLKNGNISHAYVFSGSRGTGKTSVARILANEIGTSANDLFEIDAASNNGVDEMRALTESVNTMPFDSDYKVYILDEVHMLSKSAFNALLKTLEEPPRHVIFILATTEPEKIPDTVMSRCEVYTFKTPNREMLAGLVSETATAEGYKLDDEAAALVALMGDGSFRDTHTILQKVIRSSSDKKLSLAEVEKVTGAPRVKLINETLTALLEKDSEKVFAMMKEIVEANLDIKVFMRLFLEKFRAIIVLKIAPNKESILSKSFSEDDLKMLKTMSGDEKGRAIFNSDNLLKLLEAFDASFRSSMPHLLFEIALTEIIEKTNTD